LPHLLFDGVDDGGAIVADIHAPKPGESIEESAAVGIVQPAAFPANDDMRTERVKLVVGRKWMEVVLPVEIFQES
jgi:hypothetical protein